MIPRHILNKRPPADVIHRIESVLYRERYLDGVPPKIKLNKRKLDYRSGCAEEFKCLYNKFVSDIEVGSIFLGNIKRMCDPEVIFSLKAIIQLGITPNEELAISCRDIVTDVLARDRDYISRKDMISSILVKDYYSKQLKLAIADVMGIPVSETLFDLIVQRRDKDISWYTEKEKRRLRQKTIDKLVEAGITNLRERKTGYVKVYNGFLSSMESNKMVEYRGTYDVDKDGKVIFISGEVLNESECNNNS